MRTSYFQQKKSRISLFPVFVRFTFILFVVESAQKHQIVVEINNQIFMFILEKHVFKINIKQGLVRVCVCVRDYTDAIFLNIFHFALRFQAMFVIRTCVHVLVQNLYTHNVYTRNFTRKST